MRSFSQRGPVSSRILGGALAAVLLLLPGCLSLTQMDDADLQYTAPRRDSVRAEGATAVEIAAEAGALTVVGEDDRTAVQVTGTARTATEAALDDVQVDVRRREATIGVEARLPQDPSRLDLTVRVPSGLDATIHDGTGDLEVRGLAGASVTIDDGMGDLTARDLSASVSLTDGMGDIQLTEITGDVDIPEDGMGDLDVSRVGGSVTIEEDGMGDIAVTRVDANVTIDEDGMGDIRVAEIGGNFVVRKDGMGDIAYEDVRGTVSIPEEN